eukprot:TRINITY_DN15710_c0_g1_i1.p1 TRINITY_DN15710_c0_g1~~TRINITY_DN15710_c0_g1_i1.p1  ORF type:complete len:65 (+),score=2.59 TRINITY_DN15710_c0_g1_i1:171-365(+)
MYMDGATVFKGLLPNEINSPVFTTLQRPHKPPDFLQWFVRSLYRCGYWTVHFSLPYLFVLVFIF